ncbi:MAG TPA: DMT family transporter [Solirubrobacterales bacterium]|nr:DMT family transporter [Solirubrobacterales bacterium]
MSSGRRAGAWGPLGAHPLLLSCLGALVLGLHAAVFEQTGVSPVSASLYRALYALPVLYALCRYERSRQPAWRGPRWMAALAGALLAADLVLWLRSVEEIGAGLATVLANVQLVFVVLASALLFGERLSARVAGAVGAMCLGVALIGGVGEAGAYGADPVAGAALATLAGVLYGAYILLIRRAGEGVATIEPLALATAAAAATSILIGVLFGGLQVPAPRSAQPWLVLFSLTAAAGWMLLTVPAAKLSPSLTSLVLTLQPLCGLTVGVALLGEQPSPVQWLGALVLVAGFLAALRARSGPSRRPRGGLVRPRGAS